MPKVLRTTRPREVRGHRACPAHGADWQVAHGPEGWLTLGRPFPLPAGQDPLVLHGAWAGPAKLVEKGPGVVEQRLEFFLGSPDADEAEGLQDELLRDAGPYGQGRESVPGWHPPPAEALASWLTGWGYESAIDRDQNLRVPLRRAGREGQARVERGEGRLRFVLPLATCNEADPVVETALRRLATAANDRFRLLRVARSAGGFPHRWEAQVDLSGLPMGSNEKWSRDLVGAAVRGLELALQQLALEFALLADLPELARQFVEVETLNQMEV